MKITLSTEELHWIVQKHFVTNHNIAIDTISWFDDRVEIYTKELSANYASDKSKVDLEIAKIMQSNPNDKISAIKKMREITNCGLKEAKDYVDYYAANGVFPINLF